MQQRSEETHKVLISAAEELFTQQGYVETGVAGICEKAGVSKGAFYHHFPSKQALFMELLDSRLAGLDMVIGDIVTGVKDVPDALMNLASIGTIAFQADSKQIPILLEFWEQARHDPETWKAAGAPYQRYQDYFTKIIQKGIDEGSLQPVDPEDASRLIIAVATGLLLQGALGQGEEAWGQTIEKYMEILIDGLRRRS